MRKVIVAAVLLAVLQISPPAPRSATLSVGQTGEIVKKYDSRQSHANRNPTALDQGEGKGDHKPEHQPSAPEQTVRIRELPSVSVGRNWADWTLWALSGVLSIAGVLGIVLAYKTLRAIRRQGVSMRRQTAILRRSVAAARKSANAAKKSADGLISAERAWILADLNWPERPHTYFEYSLIFTNHGPTPAQIRAYFWDIKAIDSIDELPEIPAYGEARYSGRFLAPKESWNVDLVFPNDAKVSMEKWTEITSDPKQYVVCFGYVEYGGIFQGLRYTRFCFGYNGFLTRFTTIGPPEYNKCT